MGGARSPLPGFGYTGKGIRMALDHNASGGEKPLGLTSAMTTFAATSFTIGDYLVGAAIGVVTAMVVRLVISPGLDMVIAMLAGTGIGVIVHAALGLILSPVLGLMETMVPGSLIGMYGGMLFGMRDSIGAGSKTLVAAAAVGALFGVVVVLGVKIYDRCLRGAVLDAGE